ncbi:short chain dehydrogenase [Nemania abortiva]|nr:short chain dehydrogenase [Nemania abortiva]
MTMNPTMSTSPKNRYAVITGCGFGGIGHALANRLAATGFTVIATLLPHESRDHLEHTGIQVINLDVTKEEQMLPFRDKVEAITKGKLDILVNNALSYTMTAVDTDVRRVEQMFAVNVFGPMRMVYHLHRFLVEAGGAVVNIGSVGGICPYVFGASYNASKAALHHWSNTLRVEMRPFGVRVITVISGEVNTNILKTDARDNRELPASSIFSPLSKIFTAHIHRSPVTISPDEYAKAVVAAVLRPSPPAWFFYGPTTWSVWFIDTFLPRTTWDWVLGSMFKLDRLKAKVM